MNTLSVKKILDLFGKTVKIGKHHKNGLMTTMNKIESNGALAFLNGRARCLELTPRAFGCKIEYDDLFFDFNETFKSGFGKTWGDYENDIPPIDQKNKEWYSTVYDHTKNIYDFGDNFVFEYFQDRNKYSPKFAYEQGLFHMSFVLSDFYDKEKESDNLNEFINNLTKYDNDDELKKQITTIAEEYWHC